MEADFGVDLFKPAQVEDSVYYDHTIVVTVRPISSDGLTFITWDGSGSVFDGDVRFRSATALSDARLVTHEMLHVLGFGHTTEWRSALNRHSSTDRLSLEDVAYAQMTYRVRDEQRARDATIGLAEAYR